MKTFRIIGLMSGTSMDGLDVADVEFKLTEQGKWKFKIYHSKCYAFPKSLLKRLKHAFHAPAEDLTQLSSDLGKFYADKVNHFISLFDINKSTINFVASHGQTVFHQPQKGYTLQIGNGPELAVNTELPTVVDFRSKDVALGGNGAPLIPVADHLLFSNYADSFLNLGGFGNVSFQQENKVTSYDICPVNSVLNPLAKELGKEYDEDGQLGRQGEINTQLLNQLNALDYYQQNPPKSLGWEWVKDEIIPLLNKEKDVKNKMRTWYEHIASQIGRSLNATWSNSVLVTGGGANNSFMIERIRAHTDQIVVIPEKEIIDFKEAVGFAFLGLLRWQEQVNVWSSVTGAKQNSSSGIIIQP